MNQDKSFESLFDEVERGFEEPSEQEEFFSDELPVVDELDALILMHREVHFGGSASLMLEYYEKENKGTHPEIEIPRIQEVVRVEEQLGQNLAELLLNPQHQERIDRAQAAYETLRELEELPKGKHVGPLLLANLILSEEEDPLEEIQAVVAEGASIVPSLLQLLQSDDFADSLFPGYGFAPALAARCLGQIAAPSTIAPLFEMIGKTDEFTEGEVLEALRTIGAPAREFLLNILKSRPLTQDNEQAAFALSYFGNDPEVSRFALSQLDDSQVLKNPQLTLYLLLTCEGLQTAEERTRFLRLVENPAFPIKLHEELQQVSRAWPAPR